jgi:stalled ribosome rescue protein Dom34
MDSEPAKIFKIRGTGIQKSTVNHHETHPIGSHHDRHKHNAEEHFFHEVATAMGTVEELLVFGPGLAKSHFKSHLENHHHSNLAQHLVATQPLGQPDSRGCSKLL